MRAHTTNMLMAGPNEQATSDVVGTKAATLALLAQRGFTVPDSLVLTTAAWDVAHTDARGGEEQLPAAVDAALGAICDHFGDTVLAVRSSACDEDAPAASFAGQYESVLGVRGIDGLRSAVLRCWASGSGERVRRYRPATDGRMAVLVQRQLDPDVAGVAFTANPVTGDTQSVLISAVPGIGDAVTAGHVTPDEWTVTRGQARAIRVTHRALTADQAAAIAATSQQAATVLAAAQDIEWAMDDGRLFLLQARPITAMPRPPSDKLPPGSWIKETERYTEPMTMLGASEAVTIVADGLTAMFAEYGGLIESVRCVSIGGEIYLCMEPIGERPGRAAPPWWMLGILARTVPAMRARMRAAAATSRPDYLASLAERWRLQWRPEFVARTGQFHGALRDVSDDHALAEHLRDVRRFFHQTMTVHFRMTAVSTLPLYTLRETCRQLLAMTDSEVLALVAGASESTSAPARAIAPIAAAVQADPALVAALRNGADPGATFADRPDLARAFDQWCSSYALSCVSDDPGSPTLAERPAMLARLLCESASDIDSRVAAAQAARDSAVDAVRTRLDGASDRDRCRFEDALAAAINVYGLRDDVAFVTGSLPGGMVRTAALEAGRRLSAAGRISDAEDVVDLDIDTLCAALEDDELQVCNAIEAARAERAWVRVHPGPVVRGDRPTPAPDLRALPRPARLINDAMAWVRGAGVADSGAGHAAEAGPGAPATTRVLRGTPGAAGRHTGTVRVITTAAGFPELHRGDVLVARTTDPAWSVLFGIAGALVTDSGGMLSHGAIVAREHGIPAVLAAGSATTRLHDGQQVTVDGSNGVVYIEEE